MKRLINNLRSSLKTKKTLEIINLGCFFLICFISLALYSKSPFNYINIGLFGVFSTITVFYLILYKPKIVFDVFLLCLSVIAISMLASTLLNGFLNFPRTPLLMVAMSAIIYIWMQDKKDKVRLYLLIFMVSTWLFLIAFFVLEKDAILHFAIKDTTRAGEKLGNANDIARHLAFAFIINVFFFFTSKKLIFKLLLIIPILLSAYFLLLTGSVSLFLLTGLVSVAIIIFVVPKKWKVPTIALSIALIASITLAIIYIPQLGYFKERIVRIFSTFFKTDSAIRTDNSSAGRFQGALVGFQLFGESPLFGNGFNSVYREYKIMAHNNIAEIAADYGMFALVFEEARLVLPLFKLKHVEKQNKLFVFSMVIYLLFLQLFLVLFNSKIESIIVPFVFICIDGLVPIRLAKDEDSQPRIKNPINDRPLRIIEVIPKFQPIGGAERFVSDLAKHIKNNNQNVELMVVCLFAYEGDETANDLIAGGVNIKFLNKKKGLDFRCSKDFKKIVDDFEPDVIHCHITSLMTVFFSGVYKNVECYYTFHTDVSKASYGSKVKIKNLITRHIFKRKLINPIAISDNVQQSISDYFGISKDIIPVIYNGVPLEKFKNNKRHAARSIDFLYIGRFIELKNPLTIIKAFSKLREEYPKATLKMIGTGPLLNECKVYIKQNSLEGVELLGFQNDVSNHLKDSRVLVMASNYEGNPIVINEAIASKTFVISTSVGGVPDVVSDNNGLLYSKDNIEENLYQSMVYCMDNKIKIGNLLDANYKDNRNKVSMDKTVNEYINLFNGGLE